MDEKVCVEPCAEEVCKKPKVKTKREIFRFNGEKPTAVNLEHITHMELDKKKITFNFYNTAIFVELEDEEGANSIFEALLNAWAGDV